MIFFLRDRFKHFQHHYGKSFLGECPGDAPTMAAIELNRRCIRLNDAKMQCLMAASDYFSLPLREQTKAYSFSPAFAKHP